LTLLDMAERLRLPSEAIKTAADAGPASGSCSPPI